MQIEIKILDSSIDVPKYATSGSAGMDLSSTKKIVIKRFKRELIPCGFSIALPNGYEAQIRPRSGLAIKHGITVLNTPGTIDSDYRGEIGVILFNIGEEDFIVEPKMRIAQMIISKYETVNFEIRENLSNTVRGIGGFGSTG